MQADGMVAVNARALMEAIAIAAPARRHRGDPRRRKGQPVSITFDAGASLLTIAEAVHGLATQSVPATGHWPGRVQVADDVLRVLAGKYARDDQLTLIMTRDALSILKDGSRISLKRIDAAGARGIDAQPLPPNRRHKGPVTVPPDPVRKRYAWNDTWAFSARMPIPQHRKPPR